MKVIGLSGLPGSGKSTIVDAIKDLAKVITMGDVIRDEAKKRNEAPTDDNLGKIACELREKFGPDIIAEKCVELIKKLDAEIIVIDGLRSMAEVNVFRKYWKFPIIATILDDEKRFMRLSKRGRLDDPKSIEELKERDDRELKFGLFEVIKTAEYKINSDLPLEEFKTKVKELFVKIIQDY
ncbi:MAG: AAA family ATPase [Promethearchaeota archaeon]